MSLVLLQVKVVSASTTMKDDENYMCECTSQFYIIFSFKYSNNRISYIHDITGQKNKII